MNYTRIYHLILSQYGKKPAENLIIVMLKAESLLPEEKQTQRELEKHLQNSITWLETLKLSQIFLNAVKIRS